MLSLQQTVAFAAVAAIIIAIPGPSVVFAISRALVHGRRTAMASVVGNAVGLLVLVVLVALGLGALVARSETLFWVIKAVGAAYLVHLGLQAIRHRHDFDADPQGPEHAVISWSRSLRQGFVVGVSNPKSFILVAAVLPQFVDRGTGQFGLQVFLLGVILVSIALASDTVWALLAARMRTWLSRSPRRGRLLGTIGGVSMIGLGVSVAFTGNHST